MNKTTKVGIISCSGEEIPEGTISRSAVRRVLESLRPHETVTLCLPLFLAGNEGERNFARTHPDDHDRRVRQAVREVGHREARRAGHARAGGDGYPGEERGRLSAIVAIAWSGGRGGCARGSRRDRLGGRRDPRRETSCGRAMRVMGELAIL